jgi:hypothetical protein|nr:polymer-forming cytoskeletal protein [Candidatus Krumholzibacteria bacterium]
MALLVESHGSGGGSSGNRLGVLVGSPRAFIPAFLTLFWLALAALVLVTPARGQQTPPDAPTTPATPDTGSRPRALQRFEHIVQLEPGTRDSLVVQIKQYSEIISAMRDSLSLAELGLGLELGPREKESIEKSIQHFTVLVEEIGAELGDMDLEISDNQISFLDAKGEGIIINIPENLDEQLSQGLNVLSKMILSELPDSLSFEGGQNWGWEGVALKPFGHKEKRKVIKGNVVKVWDRLQVTEREDVRGHVVVVFGDAEVSGRVDGNVVVVFGDLFLTETAEVTGEVVAVGGRLDQDPDADVHDVVVVDPWRSLGSDGPEGLFEPGPMNFLLGQGEFLAMLLFAVLAYSLAPGKRLERSLEVLSSRPMPSLAAGLAGSFGLHILALVVMAILVLTVIGIPVALLVAVALVVLGVLSVGLSALAIGRRLCRQFSGNCGATWISVALGLLVLHSVAFLGQLLGIWPAFAGLSRVLVVLGFAVKLAAYFFGLGALLLARLGAGARNVQPLREEATVTSA